MSGPWNPPDASKGDSIGLAAVGGMKPDPAVGKRDLFPLPVPSLHSRWHGASRRSQQRSDRRSRGEETVREAVMALNWLAGYDFLHGTDGEPDPLQVEVLQRIRELSKDAGNIGTLGYVPTPEAALRELLKGKSEYNQPKIPVALAPYSLERISLPASLHDLPEAKDLLPKDARRYLLGEELMLREGEVFESPRPYWDPVLANNKRCYREFIQRLDDIGLLQYTQKPKNEVGVFFVHKSDKKKIRLIVDARSANALFRDPPGVELCSSEGFSRIECEVSSDAKPGSPEFLEELRTMELHVGLSDVKDCFHRLKQPRWLSEYFCLKPIRAHWVGLAGKYLEGVKLGSNDLIYPMPGSLCMGFSWSLYFCQQINEHQCTLTRSLGDSTLITDKGKPVVFKSSKCLKEAESTTRHYVYVDNLGVLSPHKAVVATALQELDEHFGGRGLLLHPGEVHSSETRALGTILDGNNLCSKITPERFHRVRQSIRGLLNKKRVTGQMLEVVVGHATFCALNNRMLLSVFHSSYKFIKAHYFENSMIWDSVRAELTAFAGLMIFLRSDWWRPWNPLVCSSDASNTGYGVCTSFWSLEDVARVGRQKERSRFRRCEGHSARESSLTSAGFVKDEVTGCWKTGELSSEDYLNLSGWQIDQNFEEVPARLLRKDRWQPKLWGRWRFNEGILTLEARAAVKALRRVALSRFGSQIRQLFLLDNMSVTLAFERSRSRQFGLLKQVRLFNAYCIGRGIQPSFRWIPSELNSADEPSRFGTDEPSKLLTACIAHGAEAESVPPASSGTTAFKGGQSGGPAQPGEVDREQLQGQEGSCFETSGDRRVSDNQRESRRGAHSRESWRRACGGSRQRLSLEQFRQQQRFRTGAEETKEPTLSGPPPEKKVCGLPHRGQGQERADLVRKKGNWSCVREDVPEGDAGLPRLCPMSRPGRQQGRDSRQVDGAIHEPVLPGGPPSLCGRQAHCQLAASSPSIQQSWSKEDSSCTSLPQRVETPLPRKVQGSLSFGHLVRGSMFDDGGWLSQDGCFRNVGPVSMQSTLGAFEIEEVQPDPACHRSDGQLESPLEPRGIATSLKDRRLRRQCPVRLSLYKLLGHQCSEVLEEGSQQCSPVGLRLQPIPGSVQEVRQEDGHPPGAIPLPAQRPIHRPEPQVPVTAGGAKAGAMEEQQVSRSLREGGKAGSNLGADPYQDQGVLASVRGGVRRHHDWPKEVSKFKPPRRNQKGCYVADVFSGRGGVALACERIGFVSRQWDIRLGHQCDLTSRNVLYRLKCDIRSGKVLAMMMAPPCSSFSVARDRIKVIRTRNQPWGISSEFLTTAETEKIQLGNACFKSCFALIRTLDRFGIPWILENPASSKCWHLPFLQSICRQQHVHNIYSDFCQFGTIWKKHTRFVCGNIEFDDLHRVNLQCQGQSVCSVTRKPHFHLTGKGPHGRHWTEIAQPYPRRLCDGLAYALTAKLHYNYVSY